MVSQVPTSSSSQQADWINILAQGKVGDKHTWVFFLEFVLEVCRELAKRDADAFVPIGIIWRYLVKELPKQPQTRKWGRFNVNWKLPDSVGEFLEILSRGHQISFCNFTLIQQVE